MAQYIDKNALIAEIERRYEINLVGAHGAFRNGKIEALREMKDFLNTLEVKEVDINKEISQFIDANFEKATIGHKLSLRRIAKRFFELGLKAQSKDKIEALRTEYEKGRADVIAKTLKWLWDLNQQHEIMSYTDSHVLDSEELQKYYKNNIE